MRSGLVNYSSLFVAGLAQLVLIPMLAKGLGPESYGLWIAALSVAGVLGVLDLGLGFSVKREVAGGLRDPSQETARFVASAGFAYMTLGAVGAVLIAVLGAPLSGFLSLSPENRRIGQAVFGLAGLGFLADQLFIYAVSVMSGLQRFGTFNLISIAGTLARVAGIIALLRARATLLPVVAWQTAVAMAVAWVGLVAVERLEPKFRLRVGQWDWDSLRRRIPFSFASLLASMASSVIWQSAPILVGFVRGSASITLYYIGQKFSTAISSFGWRISEVLFPAASEYERARDMPRTRQVMEVGTRWVVVSVLPLCAILWIIAPSLLQAWVGKAFRTEMVSILRITLAAVSVDALTFGAQHVLWGRGSVLSVFIIQGSAAATSIALSWWLLLRIGLSGPAWGTCLAVSLAAFAFLLCTKYEIAIGLAALFRAASSGLMIPVLLCAGVTFGICYFLRPGRWPEVLAAILGGEAVYVLSLYVFGVRDEERVLFREMILAPAVVARALYRGLQRTLRRIPPLRSTFYLVLELKRFFTDTPERHRGRFERTFQLHLDPWNFAKPEEQGRLRRAVEMLDAVRAERRFHKALEVGCAEGDFTQLLATWCEFLLSVDVSRVALARAQERCRQESHVCFHPWDLFADSSLGLFDLVVVMSVLDYYVWPHDLRFARAKIVEMVRPGGYLLISSTKRAVVEQAWWGRWLRRRAGQLNQFVARHPLLQVVNTAEGDFYLHTLFRKTA